MAPHSPQRGAGAGSTGGAAPPPHPPPAAHVPPPPYVQPPPPYGPPAHQQWPVAPPNVYVSQVTANVNVHGYMGQYYQPQPQFPPPPGDRPPRAHRRDRRQKRVPSPPPAVPPSAQPPPYYVQYPPYYSAAQAQGAPLYHLPVYQPLTYVGHYPYQTYYPEYPVPVEGDDKAPDEYPPEVLMEQEAVDAYYGAHYGPPYGPPADMPLEYLPQVYVPHPHHHHPPPAPHQFNVHAKNFVQNQPHPPQPAVDALPVRELRITAKEPGSPETERPVERAAPEPSTSQTELSPAINPEVSKPAWTTEVKTAETVPSPQPPPPPPTVKTFTQSAPPPAQPAQPAPAPKSTAPALVKIIKGPAAPFSGNKQSPKPSIPPASVPVQQNVSGPKAPFANRQKREGTNGRSPSHEVVENNSEKPATPAEHPRREQPLPPSKAPMPISITLHSQGQPSIVSNKPPFGHSRKSVPVQETPPTPQPPPPAPTASDFPPPPTPRNRGEPVPPPVVQQPTPPAPGKSWASLFSNKSATVQAASHLDEPASPTVVPPPAVQKPVAKVPPFDASPLLQSALVEKSSPAPKTNATTLSYSEKTSANTVNNNSSAPPAAKSVSPTSEVRESPPQKEVTPALPVPPSPFVDDPNSYRMGGEAFFVYFYIRTFIVLIMFVINLLLN